MHWLALTLHQVALTVNSVALTVYWVACVHITQLGILVQAMTDSLNILLSMIAGPDTSTVCTVKCRSVYTVKYRNLTGRQFTGHSVQCSDVKKQGQGNQCQTPGFKFESPVGAFWLAIFWALWFALAGSYCLAHFPAFWLALFGAFWLALFGAFWLALFGSFWLPLVGTFWCFLVITFSYF